MKKKPITDIDEMTLCGISELIAKGFSRPMGYNLLHRQDLPRVQIGNRLFLHRAKFLEWLDQQADAGKQAL